MTRSVEREIEPRESTDQRGDRKLGLVGEQLDRYTTEAFALSAAMTLLLTMTRAPAESILLMTGLAAAGLVAPRYTVDTTWYWIVLFGLFIISPIQRPWLELDNHHFLHVYWLAAIVLTRFASHPGEALRKVARILIGLVFAFAVTWKLMVPEFLDGTFFEYTFGTDSRFDNVWTALDLQREGARGENFETISSWRDAAVTPSAGLMEIHPGLASWSAVFAWLTVALEGALAVAFLAPLRARWRWVRDALLMVFVVTTYPLAPVIGFGWLLVAMGAMQSELAARRRTAIYVAAFVVVYLLGARQDALDWLRDIGVGNLLPWVIAII